MNNGIIVVSIAAVATSVIAFTISICAIRLSIIHAVLMASGIDYDIVVALGSGPPLVVSPQPFTRD
jgi:hypothetical protein